MKRTLRIGALVGAMACLLGAGRARAQEGGLNAGAMAGQQVAVPPHTMVVAEPELAADTVYAAWRDRLAARQRADSMLGEALLDRAPEVRWILPPELRKVARRAPGMVTDPDQMGQAVLRNRGLKDVPDPLRSSLRSLVAVAGDRQALVPAALGFGRTEDGAIQADYNLVLVDARSGKILWRTVVQGTGPTPDLALAQALQTLLPLDLSQP